MKYSRLCGIPLKGDMGESLIQGLPVLPVGMAMNTQAVELNKRLHFQTSPLLYNGEKGWYDDQ